MRCAASCGGWTVSGMFKCNICGASFVEPVTDIYREDMDGEQHYQTFYVDCCPNCGSEEIDEYEEDEE